MSADSIAGAAGAAPDGGDRPEAAPRTRSHVKLRRAAAALLDERDPASITVTDLVNAAGVSRPTFYATYGDLADAWADAAVLRLEEAFAGLDPFADAPPADDPAALEAIIGAALRGLEPHVAFLRRVLGGSGGPQVLHRAIDFIAGRILATPTFGAGLKAGPLDPGLSARAIAAALVWTAGSWVRSDGRGPIDDLSADLVVLLTRSVVGGLGGH